MLSGIRIGGHMDWRQLVAGTGKGQVEGEASLVLFASSVTVMDQL